MGRASLVSKTTKRDESIAHGRAPAGTGRANLSGIWHF